MAINSCSSTSNLATEYAQQLTVTPLERRQTAETDPNAAVTGVPATQQATGPTVNGQGEVVGRLVNVTA